MSKLVEKIRARQLKKPSNFKGLDKHLDLEPVNYQEWMIFVRDCSGLSYKIHSKTKRIALTTDEIIQATLDATKAQFCMVCLTTYLMIRHRKVCKCGET